jgi:hypothetical protein
MGRARLEEKRMARKRLRHSSGLMGTGWLGGVAARKKAKFGCLLGSFPHILEE